MSNMNNSIRAEITFGTQFNKANAEIDSLAVDAALRKIDALAIELFDGVTWLDTRGSWVNPADKTGCTEQGQTVIIYGIPESRRHEVIRLAVFIRDTLDQNCVIVTIAPAEFLFV